MLCNKWWQKLNWIIANNLTKYLLYCRLLLLWSSQFIVKSNKAQIKHIKISNVNETFEHTFDTLVDMLVLTWVKLAFSDPVWTVNLARSRIFSDFTELQLLSRDVFSNDVCLSLTRIENPRNSCFSILVIFWRNLKITWTRVLDSI